MNSPAELNSFSASIDAGGKVLMALKIFCRHAGRSPVDLNIAISRLTCCRTSLNVERVQEGVGVVFSKKSFNSSSLVFFLAGSNASGIFLLPEIWDKDAAGQTDGREVTWSDGSDKYSRFVATRNNKDRWIAKKKTPRMDPVLMLFWFRDNKFKSPFYTFSTRGEAAKWRQFVHPVCRPEGSGIWRTAKTYFALFVTVIGVFYVLV